MSTATDLASLQQVLVHIENNRFMAALQQLAAIRSVLDPWEETARKLRNTSYETTWKPCNGEPTGETLRAETVDWQRTVVDRTTATEIYNAVRAFADAARRIEEQVMDLAIVSERTPADYLREFQDRQADLARAREAEANAPKRRSRK
jgi:hypothetical protein